VKARALAGEPWSLPGEAGDAAVKRKGALGDDQGQPGYDPFVERTIKGGGLGGEDAGDDLNTGRAETIEAAPGVGGVGVDGAHDHPGNAGRDDRIHTGRGTALGGAGLEGHVKGYAAGNAGPGEIAEGFDLRMGATGGAVPAF